MTRPAKRKRDANVALRPSVLHDFTRILYDSIILPTMWATERHDDPDGAFADYVATPLRSASPGAPGLTAEYTERVDPWEFAVRYLRSEVFSKFDDGKPSPDKELTTWERFYKAEGACLSANMRLLHPPVLSYTSKIGVWSYIENARRKIEWLLGAYSDDKIARGMSFTSGASFKLPKTKGDSAYKFSGPPETTVDNLPTAISQICSSDLWFRTVSEADFIHLAPGNKLCCVPKNYKTDRMIAIEPTMNMYVQKGIGSYIRHRLKRVGIDLDDQVPNQEMALMGSLTGGIATIDLSMASDTVSLELVRLLLPPDWLRALEQCRSSFGVLPSGKKVLYRKFSSMGNGYTFELESMIFWALAWSVTFLHDGDLSFLRVYGDDIVVDSQVADPLMDLLSFCGFSTNAKKTFVHGPFRESCGKHYFRGCDVTPFYVKSDVTRLLDLFKLHNKFYRWVARVRAYAPPMQLHRCELILEWLRDQAPSDWRRPRIPDGFGDGAFIGTFDQCLPSKPAGSQKDSYGWEGWYVKVVAEVTETGIPVDGRLFCARTKKFVRRKVPSNIDMGYLLRSLSRPRPSGWMHSLYPAEVLGGLSLGLRTRVIEILVPQFGVPEALL